MFNHVGVHECIPYSQGYLQHAPSEDYIVEESAGLMEQLNASV